MCCTLIKYGLFLGNLLFSLAGLALLGIGVAVLVQGTDVLEIVPSYLNGIPIALIVIGSLIFLISFLGCCGAIKENRWLLFLYGISMLLLAAGKTYLAVVVFRNLGDIRDTVQSWLREAFDDEELRKSFHAMEEFFRCCGTSGADSYTGIYPVLPPTCCAEPVDMTCSTDDAFPGCNTLVGDFFETYGELIGIVIIIVIAVELLIMVFSFSLCRNIDNKRKGTV